MQELIEKLTESLNIKLFVIVNGAEPTFFIKISLHVVSPA